MEYKAPKIEIIAANVDFIIASLEILAFGEGDDWDLS